MPQFSALSRAALCGAAALATSLLAGCSNMITTASPVTALSANGEMNGKIFGGNQPISGADIRLYAAGLTGYGSSPTLYASTTSASDGFGSFSFSKVAGQGSSQNGTPVYGCPMDGSDPQMYITAKGGNTQGSGNGSNSAASFIIAIGRCSTISSATYVDMNEITTVATLASLQQFFSPANANVDNIAHLGMPNTALAQVGFANGVSTISNIANVPTGTIAARTVTTSPSNSTSPITVTITPETLKINTIANIAAACVNTTSNTSPACNTLFQYATPPSPASTSQPAQNFGTATSTASAIWNMLTNPTSGSAANINQLFGLINAQAPFQPSEPTAPTDWTIGLRYTSTNSCAQGATFLQSPAHLAIDSAGNLYGISSAAGGNLFEIGPNGTAIFCVLGNTVGAATAMSIDVAGNIWVSGATNPGVAYRYNPSAGVLTVWPTGSASVIQSIMSDRAGNIFLSPTTGNALYSFSNGANAAAPVAAKLISNLARPTQYIAADTSNRLFATANTPSQIFDVFPSSGTSNATYTNGYETTDVTNASFSTLPYGVGAGLAAAIATVNGAIGTNAGNNLAVYTPSSVINGTATLTASSAPFAAGLNDPRELAIDGAGNIWVANTQSAAGVYTTGAATGGKFEVSEFNATGNAMSPTGSGTTTTTTNGGYQKDANVLPGGVRSVAIDLSGNVWFGPSTNSNGVFELVGAAVPVVTPIPAALAAGALSTNAVSKP